MRHTFGLAITLAVLGSGFVSFVSGQCSEGNGTQIRNSTDGMCNSTFVPFSNATLTSFQSCAGLQMMNKSEISMEHLNRLKGVMDEAFDLYSFMRSSSRLKPNLDLIRGFSFNASRERLHDVNFIRLWSQVKLRPRLASVSQQFLSCLSTSNFTCETYQALVKELNVDIQKINPMRQQMVYMFLIRPFLARTDIAGCVNSGNSSEEWLVQNFLSFSTLAPLRDLTALNVNFRGPAVMELLTPEQKAELILNLESGGLDNATINRVFESLLRPLLKNEHLNQSMLNGTKASNTTMSNMTAENATLPRRLNENFRGFVSFLLPLGRFVKAFVSTIQQRNVSSMSSQTLAQAIVNWTLTELAGHFSYNFTLRNETILGQTSSLNTFNISSMDDWFRNVVIPAIKRFHPNNQTEIPQDLTAAFHHVFSLKSDMGSKPLDSMDICYTSNNNRSCSVSHSTENLAVVLKCVAHSNLSLTAGNLKLLVTELCRTLDNSTEVRPMMNGTSGQSNSTDLFRKLPAKSLSVENLDDVDFIRFWFLIKLRPLLPSVSEEYLSCLSTQGFSCLAYQALVRGLSDHISSMNEMRQRLVYTRFIHPFLSQCRHSDMMNCISQTNRSVDSVKKNLGRFSVFAPLQHLFDLQRNFSALEALPALSPQQIAELVVKPHTSPPQRDHIINTVFDHLQNKTRFMDFLQYLQMRARGANLSCESYSIIFNRLDSAIPSASPGLAGFIRTNKGSLMRTAPDGCNRVPFMIGCSVTPVNKSQICAGVNTTELQQYLESNMTQNLYNFTIRHYACLPQSTQLSPAQLSELLRCKLSGNMTYTKEMWKLFFTRFSTNLDQALHVFSAVLMPKGPSKKKTLVLDILGEVIIDQFSPQDLRNTSLIHMWFQRNLQPFLPHASREFLSCLSTKNFSCGTYQIVVAALGRQSAMARRPMVYSDFIEAFLSRNDTEDPSCVNNSTNSTDWLLRYLGPFIGVAPLGELKRLYRNFSAVDVLPLFGTKQLAEFARTPGQLRDPRDVSNILRHVPPRDLGEFFDTFSPADEELHLLLDVRSALLQQVFDRANLSEPSRNDTEVLVWLGQRLKPLLLNLTKEHVAPLFNIVRHRDCETSQEAVELLNSVQSTLSNGTQMAVQHQILMSLRGSTPLRCYKDDSFFLFLKKSFLDFPFPRVTAFLSLIPPRRESELLNTMRPSELGTFLRQPEVVDNETDLCTIFRSYNRTPEFLESEEIPDQVSRPVLPCVWPLALSSDDEDEVDRWFDNRLRKYLKYLNRDLLNSSDTLKASCLPFRKLVSILGNNITNSSDFSQDDAYSTIKTYLKTNSTPKCYSATDPKLNSTNWFVNYIGGGFINFVTLDDLDTFGSESTLQLFAVNPVNIRLFNFNGVSQDLTDRYTELIFQQNPKFSPLQLPPKFQCGVPGSVFTQLNQSQSETVLTNLNQSCANVDTEVSSALASNIQTINAGAITALGQESTGLTPAQITAAPPSVIVGSLQTLGSASGWNLGQSLTIIQVLFAGNFQINSASSLLQIGSLVGGLPTQTITSIPSAQILRTSSDPTFVTNMLNAPQIVQQTYVKKIITVNAAPQQLLVNVPDDMASQIPRNLLNFPASGNQTLLLQINKKKWKPQQAALFFDTVATGITNSDDLSPEVLQGFTCTRVQTFTKTKIKGLIRACRRRRGQKKVVLKETQLTCMYNNIKDNNPQDFANYPSDMLLYYNYANVQQANCNTYFTEAGRADFNVLSRTLDGKKVSLLNNARSCLGITGTQISRENVEVLGNMCCTLDQNYIQNSDSSILEKLKNCNDFSDQQILAMENVLINGNTKYGPPSRWKENTLLGLDILPLYLRENFWKRFSMRNKRKFLKKFMRRLRRNKTQKRKLKKLFKAVSKRFRSTRAAINGCPETLGNITQVTIGDDAFPFGYEATTFNQCLSTQVVKDNLASLTEKVDDDDFQLVILEKLHQACPAGLSDQQVQVLKSVSRMASLEQINKWNITRLDTLAALMDSSDGGWDSAKSSVILTKFLSEPGNTLGASELNSVGGPNLCSLEANVLKSINNDSLRDAESLDVTECSSEKKKALFAVAKRAFPISVRNEDGLRSYQLIEPYMGGAGIDYVRTLSSSNVSMNIATFTGLAESVLLNLTVKEVQGLLGLNLPDLKTYENNTVVQNWISRQLQSELNTLGINLSGGKVQATVSPSAGSNSTSSTSSATTTAASGQCRGTYPAPFLSLLIALIIVGMQMWRF